MKKYRWLIELVVLLVAVFVGVQLLMTQVVSKDVVSGNSMQPTLENGDRLYSLRHKQVKRNDIVVINAPDAPGELYIKRVIGMPGDTVKVQNERLYVNGKLQKQPYLKTSFMRKEITDWAKANNRSSTGIQFTQDFDIATDKATQSEHVPQGEYFVMGDNRFVSHDGRAFGFIPKSKIQSVVVWRYWPLTQMKTY